MAKITKDSHLDHGLPPEVVALIERSIAPLDRFTILTLDSPVPLPCKLHGPVTGEAPVTEAEVYHLVRGNRGFASRMCRRAPVPTNKVTVIVGQHGEDVVLYTAFPGPLAAREVGELMQKGLSEALAESRAFWADHALSE